MRVLRTFALPATLFVLSATLGTGQTTDKKDSKDKKDPQQSVEPKSGPGEGQKHLAKFVGEWTVEKKFYPRGGGEPSVTKGTCKQEMIHGGRFLKSEFTFEGPNGTTTGTGVIGFEPDTGKFTSSWIDSRQTRMSFRKSPEKFAGEKIDLVGVALAGEPEARKSRTTTTLEDDGRTIVHKQYSIAADGTERPVMELKLTRKAAASK